MFDEELARDARMRERDHAVVHADLAEDAGVLLLERSAAAFQIVDDLVELLAREFRERMSAPDQLEGLVGCDRRDRGQPDDVLRDHVDRLLLHANRIERALAHPPRGHRRLDEIVDVRRHENAVAVPVQRMPGAPDALDRARDAFRRRHHHDQIDRADIDPHLEAGRANDGAQLAILQPIFNFEPHAAIERRVMRFDLLRELGQQLLQLQVRVAPPRSGRS